MKKELEDEIIKIAPYMFIYEGSDDLKKSLISFGLDIGDGWFELVKELVINIAKLDVDHKVKVFQVKEKFGTLRFYIDGGNDKINELISIAEHKSERICEVCGDDGYIDNSKYWVVALCDKCKEDRK
jgi:hypothetical protein